MVRPVEHDSRGIILPGPGLRRFRLERRAPSSTVSRFVDRYWLVAWDLDEVHAQDVLSHPVVNIVFDTDGATVHGLRRTRSTQVLEGRGRALGVMFRPAGFRVFLDAPMSSMVDRAVPFAELFPGGAELARAVPGLDDDAAVGAVDAFLGERVPAGRARCEDLSELVERIATDRSLRRVDDVADLHGVGPRQLQRLFAEHVGASPKWVIRRYRLYEAAEAAAGGDPVDWAALAATLGYSDQAHLVRDFTAAVGMAPERYARRNRDGG